MHWLKCDSGYDLIMLKLHLECVGQDKNIVCNDLYYDPLDYLRLSIISLCQEAGLEELLTFLSVFCQEG